MALLVPEYLQTKLYPASKDRQALADTGLVEGVMRSGDFAVTQRAAGANMSVDIAAGTAWVQGDDMARQGLYHVINDAAVTAVNTQITSGLAWAAGDSVNNRLDQVCLQANDSTDGGRNSDDPKFVVVQGTPTSGATLDNRSGAATLPPSCMPLADVLVPFGQAQVVTANIRDKRPWALGWLEYDIAAKNSFLFPGLDGANEREYRVTVNGRMDAAGDSYLIYMYPNSVSCPSGHHFSGSFDASGVNTGGWVHRFVGNLGVPMLRTYGAVAQHVVSASGMWQAQPTGSERVWHDTWSSRRTDGGTDFIGGVVHGYSQYNALPLHSILFQLSGAATFTGRVRIEKH